MQKARADGEPWIFYEGPPTANGRPGVHHVWARVFKDLYPRFHTMRGRRVPRKGGWDCHGLPVELEVEKELGLHNKHEIEAYGVAEFNERCRQSVHRYVDDFTSLTERSGVWIDTADAYWTLTNDYVESVWWLVKQMWDKDLVYEGHRVTPYCGRCGTALSSHEVAQGYQDTVDPSVYVRFPVLTGPSQLEGADLLVWTTTPWTLLSNVAVAVGGELQYVRVRSADGGRDLVLAADPVERVMEGAEVVATLSGSELVGLTYERPFDLVPIDQPARVIADDYVTTGEGSGLVHLAPAFGEDDFRIGARESLTLVNPVNGDAAFDPEQVHDERLAGHFVRDTNRHLIDDLSHRGRLYREEAYEHSYPHCWRCSTPLIYWAKATWFVKTASQRPAMLRENATIGWHPEHLRDGRFGNWLENNVDWAISRDRYWGTPLPVWRCENGHDTCVGSVAELSSLAGQDLSELDLHRPFIDEIRITCPQCHGQAERQLPVLDAWFDSGSMPSAQHHYPFDEAARARFEVEFPSDFICEAIDQTRGWFYSLLAVNTLVFDSTPYRNVVCLGLIVDEDGQKMSKSRGNVIDPWSIFSELGSDALRWNFLSFGQPWTPRRVSFDSIRETTSQTLMKLWNIYSFAATYAALDGWSPPAAPGDGSGNVPVPDAEHVLDRWIVSELDDTISTTTASLEVFDALVAATRINKFIDDLSNWYVRRSRRRFWQSSDAGAHATLHYCLTTVTRLLAPFCPMISDEIYRGLTGEDSVHLASWPIPAGRWSPELAAEMEAVRQLVALGRTARAKAKVKVRQPLPRALLMHPGVSLTDATRQEIIEELNVKELEDVSSISDLVSWNVVPNFRVLGPRLGPKLQTVKEALAAADGSALRTALASDGFVEVAGERLTADDVEVRAGGLDAFALAEEQGWAVALDLTLTDELREEALVRELVRVLNDLRKERGFEIADRIMLRLSGDERVERAVVGHSSWIAGEVLAVDLSWGAVGDAAVTVDADGSAVLIEMERVAGG